MELKVLFKFLFFRLKNYFCLAIYNIFIFKHKFSGLLVLKKFDLSHFSYTRLSTGYKNFNIRLTVDFNTLSNQLKS